MLWVDPTDPSVVAAVLGMPPDGPLTEDEQAAITEVVAVASEILTHASGYKIHPAGTATDELLCSRRFRRFSPTIGPVSGVSSIKVLDERSGDLVETRRPWRLVQGAVHFTGPYLGFFPFAWDYGIGGGIFTGLGSRPLNDIVPVQVQVQVTYDYTSTVTPGAKRALKDYAHELYLSIYDNESCSLPERVTSLTREGISMQLMTPTDYIDKGKVGLPRVDTWLAQVNPTRSHRASAVYTPDSPVGVPISNRRTGW